MKQSKNYIKNQYDDLINQAFSYVKQSNYINAESFFKKAIKILDTKNVAYINLSNIYVAENKIRKATNILFKHLTSFAFDEVVANHLGKICFNYNLDNDLLKLVNLSYLSDNYSECKSFLNYLLGKLYERKNKTKKAINCFKNSLNFNKKNTEAYLNLLNLLESTNELDGLNFYINLSFKNSINIYQTNRTVYFKALFLFRNKKYKQALNLINEKNLIEKLSKNKDYLIKINLLISKIYEKTYNFNEAFIKIQIANNLIKSNKYNRRYDNENILNNIKKYKKFFTKKNFQNIRDRLEYKDNSNLVFLVGFPRSGTTLLDSILRSHSKINVLEEEPYLLNLRHSFFNSKNNKLESLLDISQGEKDEIRKNYLNLINYKKNNGVYIDKLPLSIIEIGFIKIIFPESKIILSLRHPCDVVLSCFFTSFKINEAMYNFLDFKKTIRFYNEVFDLFLNYERELNLKYHKIKYEDLIYDFKNQIKDLLRYLDLKYEKTLETFYKTAKNRERISTPSYSQVINPLYTSSIGRWRNYIEQTNIDKILDNWIVKFNY